MTGVHDVDLYRRLLGLTSPWTIARVDLDKEGHKVDVWLEHEEVYNVVEF